MRGRLWLLGALLLSACGSGSDTSTVPKDALRFVNSNLPVAYAGESYQASLQVAGGVSPYQLRLSDGTLPDGLSLNGTTLSGTPKTSGAYAFSVEASDASLSTRVQRYSLTVTAQVNFELRPTLPQSGVVGESRIPLVLNHPKGATAARFQWRLPAGAQVVSVQPGDGQPVLFWKQSAGLLTLDLGFRKVPASGAQVAMLSLKPDRAVRLDAQSAPYAYQGRDGSGKLVGSQDFPRLPTAASSTQGSSAAGTSAVGTSAAGSSVTGNSATGTSSIGTSATGSSLNGTSTGGTSSEGTSQNGTSSEGTSASGVSDTGVPTPGSSSDGTSGAGDATTATSTPATSTNGGSQ